MSAGWDRTPGVSSLSATELLGKLATAEWAPWEQNTINSTIWVLLPITAPFRRRSDFLVVGMFEFIALFAVYWSKGKIHHMHSRAMLKGHLSHQILYFHSTLSTWNFSNGYLIIPEVGLSSLLCMKHLFWRSSKGLCIHSKWLIWGSALLIAPKFLFPLSAHPHSSNCEICTYILKIWILKSYFEEILPQICMIGIEAEEFHLNNFQ